MTSPLRTSEEKPTTVEEYKKKVGNRQQFRELVQKRARKSSPLNPILPPKVPNGCGEPCICKQYGRFCKVETRNASGYKVDMVQLKDRLHHPNTLYDELFKHLQEDDRYSSDEAIHATAEVRDLLSDYRNPGSIMNQLGHPDARTMKPELEKKLSANNPGRRNLDVQLYNRLLELLADMFFPGKLCFDFEFLPPNLPKRYGDSLPLYDKDGYTYSRIRLNATAVEYPADFVQGTVADVYYYRAVHRIATLLHEICHAYLQKYACDMCADAEEQVDQCGGHGWAWQRIAARVEHMAKLKLGIPVSLGRFASIQHHWHEKTKWPSVEQVDQWNLHDESTWSHSQA